MGDAYGAAAVEVFSNGGPDGAHDVGNCGGPDSSMRLLHMEFPVCQRNFQIVWHKKRYLSPATRKFRDSLD